MPGAGAGCAIATAHARASRSASVATARMRDSRAAPTSPWIHRQDADDLSGLGVDDHRHVLVSRLHRQVSRPSLRRGPTRRRMRRIAAASCEWRFASSANGFAALAGVAPELLVRHVEIGEIGEIGAAVSSPRSRCRPAASDHRAGGRPTTFGPVSGSDRNSGAAFSRDCVVDGVRRDDLEAVDDEHVVDGPGARTSRCSRRGARQSATPRSRRDRIADSSSSGRRRSSVMSGPRTTSTPMRSRISVAPPIAAKYCCGYQTASISVTTAAPIAALSARCRAEAFQRLSEVSVMRRTLQEASAAATGGSCRTGCDRRRRCRPARPAASISPRAARPWDRRLPSCL